MVTYSYALLQCCLRKNFLKLLIPYELVNYAFTVFPTKEHAEVSLGSKYMFNVKNPQYWSKCLMKNRL
jgi:hypothetical protein